MEEEWATEVKQQMLQSQRIILPVLSHGGICREPVRASDPVLGTNKATTLSKTPMPSLIPSCPKKAELQKRWMLKIECFNFVLQLDFIPVS